MLDEFVNFVDEIFPSISPYRAAQVRDAIQQHDFEPPELYEQRPLPEFSQADIFRPFPNLIRYGIGEGEVTLYNGPALMLSNTCDAENDDSVVFCVGYPFAEFREDEGFDEGTLQNIESNLRYNLFFLPRVPGEGDMVFDFSIAHTLPREVVFGDGEQEEVQRVASLSKLGYYLFISKLTVHFLRPESEEVEREERLEELGLEP